MVEKVEKIPIYLTPKQIKEAYRKLIEKEHADWFYETEVVEELLKRGKEARREIKKGKAVDWKDFRKELGV